MNRIFKKLSVERWTLSVQRYLIALAAATIALAAQAVPMWNVYSSHNFANYDGVPGNESEHFFLITNTSPPGDANNLISFTVYAGVNQGVYDGSGPDGWLADIQTDRTVFSGNGNYLPPRGEATFYLYSRYTGTAQGKAGALAEGGAEGNMPFPALTVTLPAPRPASLAAARLSAEPGGTNSVSISVISPDAHSFLLQYTESLAPTNWADLARGAVTGAVTVVADTNAAPTRFYRAVVP